MINSVVQNSALLDTAINGSVGEYTFDPSWIEYKNQEYLEYREEFTRIAKYKPLSPNVGRTPVNLEIETTYHCNLTCPFCPRTVHPDTKEYKHIDKSVWSTILEQIKGSDTKSLMMDHEGEALLNPSIVSMISDAKLAGVLDIWMHTNGNLLTPKRAQELIEAGLDKLNVSIDATTEETYAQVRPGGSLSRVEENLHHFLELKKQLNRPDLRVRVSFVFHERNAHERLDFIHRWKDHVNVVAIQAMVDMSCFDNPSKYYQDYVTHPESNAHQILNNFTCDNPWTTPVIDTDGNLAVCGIPIRETTREDLVVGNILEESLEKLWNSDRSNDIRNTHLSHSKLSATCKACALSQSSAACSLASTI